MNTKETFIYRIYENNRENKLLSMLRHIYVETKEYLNIIRAKRNYHNQCSIKRNMSSPVSVVFLVQYIQAWNKSEAVYRIMESDDRFIPYIVCVPNDLECNKNDNDVYKWFKNNGYKCINAKVNDVSWFRISTLNPDYVFYSRPYNHFMPEIYKSYNVSAYSKVCNFLYSFNFTEELMKTTINRDFFDYTYCYYASNVEDYEYYLSMRHSKYQRSIYLGNPVIHNVLNKRNDSSQGSWKGTHNHYRIMWTSRWTQDEGLGGSNFIKYKEDFIQLATKDKSTDFLIRPHPLTFSNFIAKGYMTEQDVDDFKKWCDETENVILDPEEEYINSFWNTDVLVADISGIIFEYFATGKPLIFCNNERFINERLVSMTIQLLNGAYIANDFEDVINYINMLRSGIDPLANKRQEIIDSLWDYRRDIASRLIADDIWNDRENSRF